MTFWVSGNLNSFGVAKSIRTNRSANSMKKCAVRSMAVRRPTLTRCSTTLASSRDASGVAGAAPTRDAFEAARAIKLAGSLL